MSKGKHSKLEKWRAKYAATITAVACLYSLIVSWGDNWFLTALVGLGVLISGTIAFFDIKRTLRQYD